MNGISDIFLSLKKLRKIENVPFHTVHGVLEARILKWFAIPFSREWHILSDMVFICSGS